MFLTSVRLLLESRIVLGPSTFLPPSSAHITSSANGRSPCLLFWRFGVGARHKYQFFTKCSELISNYKYPCSTSALAHRAHHFSSRRFPVLVQPEFSTAPNRFTFYSSNKNQAIFTALLLCYFQRATIAFATSAVERVGMAFYSIEQFTFKYLRHFYAYKQSEELCDVDVCHQVQRNNNNQSIARSSKN